MKGLVLGCLGGTVILIVGGVIGVYFFIWKPASNFIGGVTQFAQLSELNERVQNRSSFEAPVSGELSEDQVSRFIAVQQDIKEQLGQELQRLDDKFEQIQAKLDARNEEAVLVRL